MALKKITDADRANVGVTGLPDVPGLGVRAMQQRIDGLGNLAIDRLNEVIDAINDGDMETTVKDPDTEEFLNINEALTLIRQEIADLKETLDKLIVSVEELPEEPEEGTIYIVQGEVAVE